MHRRVAQTTTVVAHSAERWTRLHDPARVVVADTNYYGSEDIYIPPQESSNLGGYDLTTHDDNEQHHWRRLDSRGESILSGLDGPDEGEQDRFRGSPESMRRGSSLNRVAEEDANPLPPTESIDEQLEPEDIEEAIEWELAEYGLYGGSYKRLLTLYAFVPLSALITFAGLAISPALLWPHSNLPSPYPPLFPSPLPEILLSSAMFALAHQLRVPLYTLSSLLLRPDIASLLTTFSHVLLVNILRLASLALLRVRHSMGSLKPTWQDPSFCTVWWLSFNIAEVLVSLAQGYQQIALYRDVMVPSGREREFLERLKDGTAPATPSQTNGEPTGWRGSPEQLPEDSHGDLRQLEDQTGEGSPRNVNVLDRRIQHNFDKLLTIKAREELEEVYGVAPIKIPIFVSCLQRFDSIILSIGLTLLLSSAYLRSPLSVPVADSRIIPYPIISQKPFMVTFPIVLLIHTSLSSLYTPMILPRIGIHTAAYVSVLVSLMCFFAGLAVWGALS
ncbi:hypothetical protein JVT61DRAFT_4757 [Boletus reticuloceps]|uniref:Uncharacterized protein n=1 Tax=Boletus reticuloceps TaxID=495285 RepID=A0A8I2YMY7_9AGAM|nr:hypothetical protein JVT61DRAFT_4757 [Boletus reticuloceps]